MIDRRSLERRLARRVSTEPALSTVREASRTLGIPVWLVGGCVRDAALGRRSVDFDLAAGPGAPRLVRELRNAWGARGFRFRKRGVTTWRFAVGGHGIDVVGVGAGGIDEDLRRRELTINAIAFDVVAASLRDPLRGLADLRRGRLRPPRRGVFREDPVRVLRLARFAAEIPGTGATRSALAEARDAAPLLRRAPSERIGREIDGMLAAAEPLAGLELADRVGAVDAVLPEAASMRSCAAGAGRPDVWRHTLDAVGLSARRLRLPGIEALRDEENRRVLRWALLLHDVAKPETCVEGPDGRPRFHGHEVSGGKRADAILRRFKSSRSARRRISRLVAFHLRPHHLADAGAPARGLRRLVREAGDDLPLLLVHAACDARASGAPDAVARWRRLAGVLRELDRIHRESKRAPLPALLSGSDVLSATGRPPGPEVGRLLDQARDLQLAGGLRSREEALEWLRQTVRAAPGARGG